MGTRRIIRGPPGERLDHFMERFIECSGKDRNSTYIVLPTSRAVKYVQERLHERGIPYIKNAIGTLSALSENMFNMTNSDRILLDNDQRAVIIDHIIETVKDGTPMIGKMSVTSGVSYNLATFFSLIYSYGDDYPACLKEGSAKSMELELLMGKYREYLEMNSLLDREMMIRSVIDQDEPIGTVLVYGLFEPMPIEKDLLVSLKERSMNMECYVPYIDNRKLFSDDWSWIGIDEVEDVPGSRFEDIFNMESGKTSSVDLKIGKIRDRVCEIRNVSSEIRSILEEREDERIAVVLPEPDNGRRLISEIFGDYGIPFYMSRGAPLSESPLIQDLVNILRVVSFDFKRKDVVDLLGSPYLKFSYRGRRISGHEVDNISAGANVIGGRSGWKNSLENRMKVLDFEMKNPDISEGLKRKHEMEMRKLEFTKDSLMDLFSIIDHFSRKAPVGEHVRNFRKVIGDLEFDFDAGSSSKQEASALGEFFSILGSLERNSTLVPPSRITPYRFLSFLCNLIARKTYRPVQTNHSTVQVVGLRELAGLDFDTIFIVGMAEGEIPRTRLAHPFLNEAEIGRMNVLKREDLLRQERYYFWTDLLAASKSIYLSCPETDDDKPLVPSHFMMQMMDGYEYEEWGDNQIRGFGLNDQLEDGSRIVNRDLSNLASEMDLPGMVSRINSESYYRRLDSYSIHDGIIEDIDVLGSIREEFSEEKAFSPSSLERYANCPFEFLLRYVLYLDKRDEVDETLTPLEKGNLIHHILFRFYRERKEKKINERNSDEALSRII
ncbi:MAG: PD-(D/E)XK nuclease family protein, partial [Candidatus Thermoplasmatota archaeon]|nr:PD-(D/E)XK nuclease family protein [Candidatus Thermoplasmatota archaeon]